jgi:heme a synthase
MTQLQVPVRRDPLVGAWLALLCVMVAGMVLVGGATRLTDSGLSITEWDFAKHFAPPLTQAGWDAEFALYQRTTEYQLQNRGMALGEFQYIYLWEWGHRFLGQLIGLVFALPFFAFLFTGRLKGRVLKVLGFGLLGGLQGFVGWWMVTSGLYGRLDVSSVRLAIHLGVAFAIIGYGFWLTLEAFGLPRGRTAGGPSWRWSAGLAGLVYLQVIAGALVAGSDAGRIHTDWPTIDGAWAPANYGAFSPGWTNFTENLLAVQFHHRMLGYLVLVLTLALAWSWRGATGPGRTAAAAAAAIVVAQATLGVATLVLGAPLWISLIHQFGAVILWLAAVFWMRAAFYGIIIPKPETVAPQGLPKGV